MNIYTMSRGDYTVNRNDHSFKSFISALLVFLAGLILIYLLLFYLSRERRLNDVYMNGESSRSGKGYAGSDAEIETSTKLTTSTPSDSEFVMVLKKNGSKLFERIISKHPHSSTTRKNYQDIYTTHSSLPTTTEEEFVFILGRNGSRLFERIISTKSTTSLNVTDVIKKSTIRLPSSIQPLFSKTTTEEATSYHGISTTYVPFASNETGYTSINFNSTNHNQQSTITDVPRITTTTTTTQSSSTKITSMPLVTTTEFLITVPVIETEPIANLYCDNTMCMKSAAKMTYMLKHDVDRCSDFYDYACGGQIMPEESFFNYIREDIFMYITNSSVSSKKHIDTFNKVYSSCRVYMGEYNFRLTERLKYLKHLTISNINELFLELILTQSMPFFDVGIGISNSSAFQIELTAPGRSTLKNSISNWNLRATIEKHCLEEEIRKVTGDQFDMDVIFYATKHCTNINIFDFIEHFAKEIQSLHGIVGDNIDLTFKESMLNLFSVLKDDSLPEKSTILLTMKELNRDPRFAFGLDWNQLFRSLNVNFNDNTVVKIGSPNYLINVFNEFQTIESNLTGIFSLWYHLQLYKNTVVPKHVNRDTYCLDLTSQLMPDVTASIIHNLGIGNHFNAFVAAIFKTMKSRLGKSFEKSNMTKESLIILKKRLDYVTLWQSIPLDDHELEKLYNNIVINEASYQHNVVQMLKNYRRRILGMLETDAKPEMLASYFLNPYEIRPQSFYPTKNIVYHPGLLKRITKKVPLYVTLAQIGFSLAQELAVYFEKNDYIPSIAARESKLYDTFISDAQHAIEQLTDNISCTFNGHRYLITAGRAFLDTENVIRDDMAFRIVTDWFEELKNTEALVWLNETFTKEEIFLIMVAQDYCAQIDMFDFANTLYKAHQFPAPMKIRNIMRNSELFLDTFDCHFQTGIDKKFQFPYDNSK